MGRRPAPRRRRRRPRDRSRSPHPTRAAPSPRCRAPDPRPEARAGRLNRPPRRARCPPATSTPIRPSRGPRRRPACARCAVRLAAARPCLLLLELVHTRSYPAMRGYDRLAVIKLRLSLIVMVVLAGWGGGGGTTQRGTAPTPPPPAIAAKVKTFKLGGEVWDVAATRRLIWVAQRGEGRVLRLTPSGRRIGPPTRLSSRRGTPANDLAADGSDVFLAYAGNDGRVARLDPATGRIGPALRVGRGA